MPIGGIRTPEILNQWPWMLSLRSLKTCLNSNFFANREAHAQMIPSKIFPCLGIECRHLSGLEHSHSLCSHSCECF